jgi:hypothetical protein
MSVARRNSPVVLERASQKFVEATSTPPFVYQLPPVDARKVLDDVQAAPIDKLPVEDRWITVPAKVGDVRVRIVRPPGVAGTLPAILYMHGGGWVLGNADTHVVERDRAREHHREGLARLRRLLVGEGVSTDTTRDHDRRSAARWPRRRPDGVFNAPCAAAAPSGAAPGS